MWHPVPTAAQARTPPSCHCRCVPGRLRLAPRGWPAGSLPGPATRADSYAAWGKALSAYLYQSARTDLLSCDALKQVSGSIGGPIIKDKTFFFVDYQGTRRASADTAIYSVPTRAQRNGDFSAEGNSVIYDPLTGEPGKRRLHVRAVLDGNALPILGEIGEHREQHEAADEIERLGKAQPIEPAQLAAAAVMVFGQEGPGVTSEALAACTAHYAIAQFGSTRSINAGAAALAAVLILGPRAVGELGQRPGRSGCLELAEEVRELGRRAAHAIRAS